VKKRFLSLALVMILVFSILLTITIYAAPQVNFTKEEAVSWVLDAYKLPIDYDGSNIPDEYGGDPQCVDLVKYYTAHLGYGIGFIPCGYAWGLDSANGINNYTILDNTNAPMPGDIFVWRENCYGALYTGHTGVITSVDSSNYYYVDWNGAGGKNKAGQGDKPLHSFSYLIRPNFKPSDTTPPTIENHTVYFNANGGSVSTVSKTVIKGETYGDLPTPTREYYNFVGWFTSADGGTQVASDTIFNLNNNQTLYAHWERIVLSQGQCGDNASYVLYADGEMIISGSGDIWDFYRSTPWYAYNDRIRIVTINNSITKIGSRCFNDCKNLTNIAMPESLTIIGHEVFYDCRKLFSINIGRNVTSIGSAAFNGSSIDKIIIKDLSSWCNINFYDNWFTSYDLYLNDELITELIIPDGIESIKKYAFTGCNSIKKVTISNSVTSIGRWAFMYCDNIESIDIPNSVLNIEENAFGYCPKLTTITIPNSVTNIGAGVCCNCRSLQSINVNSNNQYYSSIDGNLLNKQGTEFIQYADGNPRVAYTIPNGVNKVLDSAFSSDNLISVTIPNSVTDIDAYAFFCCSNLENISMPDSLIHIGREAFGGTAYYRDAANWEDNVLYLGHYLIVASNLFGEYKIKDGTICIGDWAINNSPDLLSLVLPDTLLGIGCGICSGCEKITSLKIPDSVRYISDNAFVGNLNYLYIGSGIKT